MTSDYTGIVFLRGNDGRTLVDISGVDGADDGDHHTGLRLVTMR